MQHSNALNPFNHRAEYSLNACAVHPLASVCIFSILFSIHFVRCWQGEVLWQTRASLVCDPFLYCRYLNVRFRGDTVEIICESLLKGKGSTQYEWLFLTQYKPFRINYIVLMSKILQQQVPLVPLLRKNFPTFKEASKIFKVEKIFYPWSLCLFGNLLKHLFGSNERHSFSSLLGKEASQSRYHSEMGTRWGVTMLCQPQGNSLNIDLLCTCHQTITALD